MGNKKVSIRKRIFGAMLFISIIPIVLFAFFIMNISQGNMKQYIVRNRTIGMNWMNDKLAAELQEFTDLFYTIEVNKDIKKSITSWAFGNGNNSNILNELRADFEETLNRNANIRSIEIYNYSTGDGYIAARESFHKADMKEGAYLYEPRPGRLQTNAVIEREGSDYLILHQIKDFAANKKIAVLVVRANKYAFADVIEKNMEKGESAVLFNDNGVVLEEFYDNQEAFQQQYSKGLLEKIKDEESGYLTENNCFYFYETISQGKLNLLFMVPDRLIRSQLIDTLRIAGIMIASSFAAAVLLSGVFSEMISKPIVRLSKKMQVIDIHNFDAQNTVERGDEIGLLQDSFEGMMKRNQELVAREYQSELEKKEAQLKTLQAQINPHFLYNTLQVIGGMSLAGKGEEIYPVVTALSDILRYAVNFSQETVMLSQEIEYLRSYISIQNSRFDNRIQFDMEIEEMGGSAYIPKLILQPLVENALEHGLRQKKGVWRIKLTAYTEEETESLIITVCDNGAGMSAMQVNELHSAFSKGDKSILSSPVHVGLANVNARIKLLSGPAYGVNIVSRPEEGTAVTIKTKLLRRQEE